MSGAAGKGSRAPDETAHEGDQVTATALLAFAMALSGTVGVVVVASGLSSVSAVFFRCLFGAMALSLWCILRRKFDIASINRGNVAIVVISGLFLVVNWAALFQSVRLIQVGLSFVIYHLQPFWIIIIGAAFLGERLSKAKLLWTGVAFVGLILVVGPKIGAISADWGLAAGIFFALLASVLYAGSTLTARRITNVDPSFLAIVHCVIGMVVFSPVLAGFQWGEVTAVGWSCLVSLGIVQTGVVYTLLYATYPKVPTATIAICAFLNPITALVSDYLVYGHSITLVQGLGVAIIMIAELGVTVGWGRRLGAAKTTA
ncbi:DMT family transporter [Breoghania sp. JC706]|uniref:DMT family transporter n=1 Tax=Breoghania sp. JC706 TaxID=3117732 RepID=UPI00300A22FB